jgi:hypothetical protein
LIQLLPLEDDIDPPEQYLEAYMRFAVSHNLEPPVSLLRRMNTAAILLEVSLFCRIEPQLVIETPFITCLQTMCSCRSLSLMFS